MYTVFDKVRNELVGKKNTAYEVKHMLETHIHTHLRIYGLKIKDDVVFTDKQIININDIIDLEFEIKIE